MASRDKELQDTIDHLRGQLQAAADQSESLKERLSIADEEVVKLVRDLSEARAGSGTLEEQLSNATQRMKRLNKQLGGYRGHHKTRKDKVQSPHSAPSNHQHNGHGIRT